MPQRGLRNILFGVVLLVVAIIVVGLWGPGPNSRLTSSEIELTEAQSALSEASTESEPADDAPAAATADDAAEDDAAETDPADDGEGNNAEGNDAEAESTTPEQDEPEQDESEQDTAAQDPPQAASAAAGVRRFVLDPAQSEARFIIDEILFGEPNTVVGSTNAVSGTLTVNLDDLAQTSIDPVVIDASELATDNRFRNRSLRRLILQSNRDEYQYITFTPNEIEGLPERPATGEAANLTVTGDLQIRDIVAPATFAVTVTATSDTVIEGLAVGMVQRADFDLQIPDVDGVAEVSEDVRLELEFVALAEE